MRKVWLILCCSTLLLNANEAKLLEQVKTDALLENSARVIKSEGHTFLVAVGKAKIRGEAVKDKINARKEAKIKAQNAMKTFVYASSIDYSESLEKTTVTTLNMRNKDIHKTLVKSVKHETIVKENSNGILTELKPLGKWKRDTHYFFSVYYPLPD